MAEQKDRRSGIDRRDPRQYEGPLFESLTHYGDSPEPDWTLAVDVGETASEIVLRADISGMREEEVHVQLENGVLTISGERIPASSDIEWFRIERPRGLFSRSFVYRSGIDPQTIRTTVRNGILEVTIAKRADAVPAQFRIGFADGMMGAHDTPLERQLKRNAAARAALFEEFGRVRLHDVPAPDRERIFAVKADGDEWVPSFELDERGTPLPVIARVLSYLGGVRSPWELALWFTSANGWLDGSRPVDLLGTQPERVSEAARHEAEQRVF